MAFVTALLAGVLFGLGLLLSRMVDPQRVLGFLDVTGHWNPSLAFTMGGAVLIAAPAFRYVRRRGTDLAGTVVDLPNRWYVDRTLIGGSALFGIGWGLSGICPGPSLLLLSGRSMQAAVFVAALIAGSLLQGWVATRRPGVISRDAPPPA